MPSRVPLANGFYLYSTPRTFDGIGTILRVDRNGATTAEANLRKLLDPSRDIESPGSEQLPKLDLFRVRARDIDVAKILGTSYKTEASAHLVVQAVNVRTQRLTDDAVGLIRDSAEARLRELALTESQSGVTYSFVRMVNLARELRLVFTTKQSSGVDKEGTADTSTVDLRKLLDLVSLPSVRVVDSSANTIEFACEFDTLYNIAYFPLIPRRDKSRSVRLEAPVYMGLVNKEGAEPRYAAGLSAFISRVPKGNIVELGVGAEYQDYSNGSLVPYFAELRLPFESIGIPEGIFSSAYARFRIGNAFADVDGVESIEKKTQRLSWGLGLGTFLLRDRVAFQIMYCRLGVNGYRKDGTKSGEIDFGQLLAGLSFPIFRHTL